MTTSLATENNLQMSTSSKNCQDLSRPNLRFEIIKEISHSNYYVYLAWLPTEQEYCAVKIFPFRQEKPCSHYIAESRFAFLSHPNILSVKETNESISIPIENSNTQVSYILMDAYSFNFDDALDRFSFIFDEKLCRTFFKQLISGVEYLHSQGIAHLDLKLKNLMISSDFELKIIDFDHSYVKGDKSIKTRGTSHYRAPELREKRCFNPAAADVYSLGVILFTLISQHLPYLEDKPVDGHDLQSLLYKDVQGFWEAQELLSDDDTLSESFKSLFESMTREDPEERITLERIKNSEWLQGETYNSEEVAERFMTAMTARE